MNWKEKAWNYRFTFLYAVTTVVVLWSGFAGNLVGLAAGTLLLIGTVLLRIKSSEAEAVVYGENIREEVTTKNEDSTD